MHMIRHQFHLNDCIAVFILLLQDQFFDPAINWWNKYLAPILRTKDNMVLATVYNGSVAVQFVRGHAGILIANICSVNPARG